MRRSKKSLGSAILVSVLSAAMTFSMPAYALTVGVGTVMAAKEVLILCNGHNKAKAMQAAVEGPVTQMWTISALQLHRHGIIVCDDAATDELKVGTYRYFKDIEKDQL